MNYLGQISWRWIYGLLPTIVVLTLLILACGEEDTPTPTTAPEATAQPTPTTVPRMTPAPTPTTAPSDATTPIPTRTPRATAAPTTAATQPPAPTATPTPTPRPRATPTAMPTATPTPTVEAMVEKVPVQPRLRIATLPVAQQTNMQHKQTGRSGGYLSTMYDHLIWGGCARDRRVFAHACHGLVHIVGCQYLDHKT